ncbi:hypothetical protein ACJJH9_03855 [Microbulbifer sp. DLAB2-AF]|uniref:hypothetical protein n=1 Tax=Microbulbifer sp. DLAB2-AF TaxID=3243395 RepID=UPI004038FD81
MALNLRTTLYGFGSYFNDSQSYNDIDLLIVHDSIDRKSCLNAISLKKHIAQEIRFADISILSKSAELEFDFIMKSKATFIFEFEGEYRKSMFSEISKAVLFFKNINRVSGTF